MRRSVLFVWALALVFGLGVMLLPGEADAKTVPKYQETTASVIRSYDLENTFAMQDAPGKYLIKFLEEIDEIRVILTPII